MYLEPNQIKKLSQKYLWRLICHQENIGMMSYSKKFIIPQKVKTRINLDDLTIREIPIIKSTFCRINIYYTKGTVGTALDHPTKGKTQLFRKNVTYKQLEKLFINPRQHTGKGYYQKW